MSKSELTEAAENLGITITSVHMGLEWEPGSKYPMDKWSCTLHYKDKSATFSYGTGIGQRVPDVGWKVDGYDKWHHVGGKTAHGIKEGLAMGALALKRRKTEVEDEYGNKRLKWEVEGPSLGDVLRSYLDEAGACETTFDDWCSNYGVSNDSISQLNTYLACQRSGMRLIQLLGYDVIKELRDKQH